MTHTTLRTTISQAVTSTSSELQTSGSFSRLRRGSLRFWAVAQVVLWLVGVAMVAWLWFKPDVGIDLFWNGLIPAAPALVIFLPGVWRNICPLSSSSLLVGRLTKRSPSRSLSRSRPILSATGQGIMAAAGVLLLWVMVPLRHVILDTDGAATAILLMVMAVVAMGISVKFVSKSAWCSGLCPVHAVEKLYGIMPAWTAPNAHCKTCEHCVVVCPESTPNMHPLRAPVSVWHAWAGTLMAGGFVGFVWGWFHVPDYQPHAGWRHLAFAYAYPWGCGMLSLCLYLVLQAVIPQTGRMMLVRFFAAGAVSCYYWYRLPALIGYSLIGTDGMLVDLSGILSPGVVWFCRVVTTALFFGYLLWPRSSRRSWTHRPPLASFSRDSFQTVSLPVLQGSSRA